MKGTRRFLWAVLFALVIASPSILEAKTVKLSPAQAVALPADGGMSRVVLLFDLAGLPAGGVVTGAFLDCRVSGVPSDRMTTYWAHAATSAWTPEDVARGSLPAISAEASARWELEPLDYERNGGGFVRLDLTELVDGWRKGVVSNFGLVVATGDGGANDLRNGLSGARLAVSITPVW